MVRLAANFVLAAAAAAACPAQDAPKWEPPAPPKGWKAVASKDGTYWFAFPDAAPRTGTRDRNYTIHGIRVRSQTNYCLLKDGTLLEVNASILSGPGVQGVTVAEAIDAIIDGEKDDGFQVSA